MTCCRECFADRWLREFIERKSERGLGTCPRCGSESDFLIDAAQLAPYFEPLADAYAVRANGIPLATAFQEDWRIFAPSADSVAIVREMVGVGGETLFQPKESDGGITLETWEGLRSELVERNRYFPDFALSLEAIKGLVAPQLEKPFIGCSYFRARIQPKGELYGAAEMGAPPAGKATAGRANPIGIPYLYLASDIDTAISEVKPQKGASIAVAEFVRVHEHALRVVDLVNPRDSISPFLQPAEISRLRASIPFIEALETELSVPVQSADATLEYLASQYVCEMFKKSGYHGVRYRSSVGPGQNFAFFDPTHFALTGEILLKRVTSVHFDTD